MFRKVRKKKNALNDEAAKRILREMRYGVLALNGEDGYPYAIPVNYFYSEDENRIYFHSAKAGYKTECIENCDKVCFTVVRKEEIRETDWAPFAKSAVVFGRCSMLDDSEKAFRIKQFAMKYYPSEELADARIAEDVKNVRMYVIDIEHMTGKEVEER